MKQTKVSAVRLVMANLAAVQAPSTQRKAGGMKQTKVSAVRLDNGQSGRGPSPFDPSKGWWDEADQSVGSPFGNGQSGRGPSPFDPSQGWWDEADQSVGRRLSSSWLYTLATAKLNSGPTGSCVTTTLGNMDRLGIPSFSGGTTADPNNSRGAMVQMIKAGRWTSKNLPGSRWTTIRSAYGTEALTSSGLTHTKGWLTIVRYRVGQSYSKQGMGGLFPVRRQEMIWALFEIVAVTLLITN